MIAKHESDRLRALFDYGVLDTAPEEAFDRITALAAALFNTPIAAVSLVDADRRWFKSQVGLEESQTPRSRAFCDHAIRQGPSGTFVVEDAALDPRFADSPLVAGDGGIRFYAGAALTTPDGQNIGALCVKDRKPRPRPSDQQLEHLKTLAQLVVNELEVGRITREAERCELLLELVESIAGTGHWRFDVRSRSTRPWRSTTPRTRPGSARPSTPPWRPARTWT